MGEMAEDSLNEYDDSLDWMEGECQRCGKSNGRVMWAGVKCVYCGHVQHGDDGPDATTEGE